MSDTQTKSPAPADAVLKPALRGVTVTVTVVAGRKQVTLEELAAWQGDMVVPLDRGAEEPLELHVGGTCVATAELCEEEGGGIGLRILDVDRRTAP